MSELYNLKTRKATVKDALAIAEIHVASWQQTYVNIMPAAILKTLNVEQKTKKWDQIISSGTYVVVIEDDNKVIGFTCLCPARDRNEDQTICAEIAAMYVHPNACRKGVGSKLMQASISQLKTMGFSDVILWVLSKNSNARQFYEKMGFLPTNQTKSEPIVSSESSNLSNTQEIKYHISIL